MVTKLPHHWDELPNRETQYKNGMLKPGVDRETLQEGTDTIFIRLNAQSRQPEKAWKGSVNNFERRSDAIYFKVAIDHEISVPAKYQTFREGWYIDADVKQYTDVYESPDIDPAFFATIRNCRIGQDFEHKVFHLLKIVGFHDVYQFDPSDQAGRPDGFIKFEGLAILYDATLKDNYQLSKRQQIDNYCNILRSGTVSIGNRKFDVSGSKKQVWFITKNDRSTFIENRDQIKVIDVSINDLFLLYRTRVQTAIDSEEFESRLLSFYRTQE